MDAVITFKPLTIEAVEVIARKELAELGRREGLAAAELSLQCSDRLAAWVAREGYDHRLGARPLQRAIERLVVTPLARWQVAHPGVRKATLLVDLEADGTVVVIPLLP